MRMKTKDKLLKDLAAAEVYVIYSNSPGEKEFEPN